MRHVQVQISENMSLAVALLSCTLPCYRFTGCPFFDLHFSELRSRDKSKPLSRRHAPQRSPRSECLLQLIMAQLAALLQLTQLWTVLGALTPDPQATVTADDNAQGILANFSVQPHRMNKIFVLATNVGNGVHLWILSIWAWVNALVSRK